MFPNVGVGEDIFIHELAELIADIVGCSGAITTDPGKPDGTPRKLLNVDRINALGWNATTPLAEGVSSA